MTGPAGSYSEEPPSVDPETAKISQDTMASMTVGRGRRTQAADPAELVS